MKKILIASILISLTGLVIAQQAGFKRTLLQTQDLSIPEKVVVQALAEFSPGVAAGRHTHPGEEIGYVLEGQLEIKIDGKPSQIIQAGQTFFIPSGMVHDGINTNSGNTKVLATYVVEKGKPVATPVK